MPKVRLASTDQRYRKFEIFKQKKNCIIDQGVSIIDLNRNEKGEKPEFLLVNLHLELIFR
jgi:hypothetical protein